MPSKAEPRHLEDDHGVYGTPGDMTPWDIRYDPDDRAFFDTDADGSLRFRIWTDPALKEGMLVVRSGDEVVGYEMTVAAQTIRYSYWELVADRPTTRAEYSFAFRSPNGKGVYRVPSGVSNAVERLDRWPLDPPPPLSVPSWAKGTVIYQIFPDRFARGGSAADPRLEPWGSTPDRRGFQGGDLAGITAKLDYLADIGVGVIYLNPIFASPSSHRYDTVDYYTVDPLLGGNHALKGLVTEAHERSLRVILDASFNHVHPRFFAFQDVVDRGPESDYWDWFIVDEWPMAIRYRPDLVDGDTELADYLAHLTIGLDLPVDPTDSGSRPVQPTYDAWYGTPTMPRVNLANPDARAYMLDVAAHWPREYDIDGWRMDVVRYVDPDFWNDFRSTVRAVRPDAFLLSEVMGDASMWLQGDRFDATMNYTFRDLCLRFFATEDLDGEGMMEGLSRIWAQYAWPVTLANHNLIGSHDTPRFLTESGGEGWRVVLATVLQMTYPGSPGIYYGDEVGLGGGDDPECRGAFPTDADASDHEVRSTIRSLAGVRRSEPALVAGEWRPLEGRDGLIVFERALAGRRLIIAINRSDKPMPLQAAQPNRILWGKAELKDGLPTVSPRSGVVAI